jgi:hypothetical protein
LKTKIFSIGFIGFLSIWMLFQSCNGDSENDLSKGNEASQDYKHQLISSKTAQALGDSYLSNNYTLLVGTRTAKGLSQEDARQVVYPIEVLEAYVDHVKAKVGNGALIGVNIGQYPADQVIDNHQLQSYKGYQTMYLMSYKTANDTISPDNCVEAMNHGNLIPPDAPAEKNAIIDKNFENYLITDAAALLLYNAYTQNNEKTLDAQGIEVKRQYFYSVDVLKGYLQYVKEEAVAKGITEVNISINIGQNSFSWDAASKGKQKGGSQCIYFTAFPRGSNMKDMVNNPLNELSALK